MNDMPKQLVVCCVVIYGECICVQDSMYVKFVSEAAAGGGFKALHGWIYNGINSAVSKCRSYILILGFCL